VLNGSIRKGDKVKFVATGKTYNADEVGVLRLNKEPREFVGAGDVGYLISGIKNAREVKVGDTITHVDRPTKKPSPGLRT
jgi:GTP-binding protein LepA